MDNTLNIKIQAEIRDAMDKLNQLNRTLDNASGEAEKAAKSVKNFSAVDLWAGFQMAKGAVQGVIGSLTEFVDASNQYNLAMKGLSETARVFGQDQEKANEYAKQLSADGLMSVSQSAQSLKMLMSSGFSIEEAFQLANSMKDIGAFNNTIGDLGQAMVDVSKGIKTGSIELIENIGLTEKLSSVMDRANVETKNGIDVTNNAAQRRALFNSIVEQGNQFQGNAAKLAKEGAGAYAQLGTAWNDLKIQIGDALNKVFVPMVKALADAAVWLKDHLPLAAGIAAGAVAAMIAPTLTLTGTVTALGAAITAATGGLNLLIAGAVAFGVAGVAYIATLDNTATSAKAAAERLDQLKTSVKNLSDAELDAAIEKAQIEDAARRRTIAYMELKDKELEQRMRQAALTQLTAKKESEAYKTYHEALLAEKQALDINSKAWEIYVNQRAKNMMAKGNGSGSGLTEEEQKALEEKRKKEQQARNELKKTLDAEEKEQQAHLDSLAKMANDELKEEQKKNDEILDAFRDRLKKEQKLAADAANKAKELHKDELARKKAEEEAAKQKAETEKAAAMAGWNTTLQLANMMGEKNAEMFAISKGLNIANATMSTWTAATKALEAGPIMGPIFSAITVAAGLANVANIASQTFEPVSDFISIPGRPLLKAREDDIVIGGTNLFGGGNGSGGDNGVVQAVKSLENTLKRKPMTVAVDPLTGETVYKQNLQGERSVQSRRV